MICLRNASLLVLQLTNKKLCNYKDVKTLYSASALGIDNYLKTRQNVKNQFHNIEGKFKEKMNDFSLPDSTSMIFTEDLKHVVHLVEGNDDDLNLVQRMMTKFSLQNKELRFGSFIFGPVVMRMYYYLNKPVQALEAFKDDKMEGFFDQLISFQLLMDLLLKNDMYKDVLEVFEIVQKKQLLGSKYPKNCVVLALAACYKMNTHESFSYCKKVWTDLQKVGHIPMRRAGTFSAALAIAQNAPDIALEILTSLRQQNYVTIRNLKIGALADLNRPDDAIPILRSLLEYDGHTETKHTVSSEMIEKVRHSVEKYGKKETLEEFERIEKQLQSLGLISSDPLSVQLCAEIVVPTADQMKERRIRGIEIPSRKKFGNSRPGLQDLL